MLTPTFAEKAAALLHSLARNRALVDGNKRLAWAATRVFCLINGSDLAYAVDNAEAIVVAAAAGELDVPDLAESIRARPVAIDRSLRLPPVRGPPPTSLRSHA
jgi:death on curing protein